MPHATPLEFAQQRGASVSVLDVHTRQRVMQAWRETFARAVKSRTGNWVHLGYEWHAFSYDFTRSKSGARGLALYLAEAPSEVYVFPEDEGDDAFLCRAPALFDFSDCEADIIVFRLIFAGPSRSRTSNRIWARTSPDPSGAIWTTGSKRTADTRCNFWVRARLL